MNFTNITDFLDRITSPDTARGRVYSCSRIPGCELIINFGGREVYHEVFGFADIEEARPLRRGALYNLYSVSKVLTVVTALTLVERGELLMSDPVSHYIPAFASMKVKRPDGSLADAEKPVLAGDLFAMTSGIDYNITSPSVLKLLEGPQQIAVVALVETGLDVLVVVLVKPRQIFQVLVPHPPGLLFFRLLDLVQRQSLGPGCGIGFGQIGFDLRAIDGWQIAFLGLFARHANRLFFAAKTQHVLFGPRDLVVQILVEMIEHVRVGQLLGQHRRDPDRDLVPKPLGAQVIQRVQQRDIRLARGFVNPFLAVRPAPGQPRIGQVTVKDKRKSAKCTHRASSRHLLADIEPAQWADLGRQ